jgi:(p)ppGpp synthase/HD superfamily hydrolase
MRPLPISLLENEKMNLVEKARLVAHEAHDSIGQVRKYTGAPYWTHTDEVTDMYLAEENDEIGGAACSLHDILEDVFPVNAKYSRIFIATEFNDEVLKTVDELTDVYTKENAPELNRRSRKELERKRLSKISVRARNIKLCDLRANTKDIVPHDRGFALTYLREKQELLPLLKEGANPKLYVLAEQALYEGLRQLGLA